MTRRQPDIDTNPLAGRFRVARTEDEPAAEQPAPAPPPQPPTEDATPSPPVATEQVTAPPPQPPSQPRRRRQSRAASDPASDPASNSASDVATNVVTSQAGSLAEQQAGSLAAAGDARASQGITTGQLRRRRNNPWRDNVQTGVRLPRFQREYLRTVSALSGGEDALQNLVAQAVQLLAIHRGEEHLLEEAWIDEGGVPGRRDEFRPR